MRNESIKTRINGTLNRFGGKAATLEEALDA